MDFFLRKFISFQISLCFFASQILYPAKPPPCHPIYHFRGKILFILLLFVPQFQHTSSKSEMVKEGIEMLQVPIFFIVVTMIFVKIFWAGPAQTLYRGGGISGGNKLVWKSS